MLKRPQSESWGIQLLPDAAAFGLRPGTVGALGQRQAGRLSNDPSLKAGASRRFIVLPLARGLALSGL